MRIALVLLALCASCSKRNSTESLVLQGRVADEAGPSGVPTCTWRPVQSVRLDRDTVWVNDSPWSVESEGAARAFVQRLELCGGAEAIAAFRSWRSEEEDAAQRRRANQPGTLAVVGATAISGAAEQAAGPGAIGAVGHAVRDANLEPIASPATQPPDAKLEAARQQFIDSLSDSAADQ